MRKLFIITIILLVIGLTVFYKFINHKKSDNTTYEQRLANSSIQNITTIKKSAWIAGWTGDLAFETLRNSNTKINEVLPVWYQLDKDGKLVEIPDVKYKNEILEYCVINNIVIIPSITNNFDPESVSKLLDSEELQTRLIKDLVSISDVLGFKGWDLDWEEMYAGDKQGFTDFVVNLSKGLHEKQKLLSVTVQAKTGSLSDNPSNQAQDWELLSKSADVIRIMAYDFHNLDSDPGPVTPLDSYEAMLKIAVTEIPKSKINIGLPTYGYDWSGDSGDSLQYAEIMKRLNDRNIITRRDEESAELWGKYKWKGVSHEIWYEDAKSTEVKINIARKYGVTDFTFWRLGGEDPNVW